MIVPHFKLQRVCLRLTLFFLSVAVLASLLSLIVLCVAAFAAERESFYTSTICKELGGQVEYRLPDGTRCDCLTDEYAIEVEFAPKWKEAIGQALHYARLTGKKPAIVLLVDPGRDLKYLWHLSRTIDDYCLPIFLDVISIGGR